METALTGVGRLANKSPCYKLAAWIAAITADKSLSRSTTEASALPDALPAIYGRPVTRRAGRGAAFWGRPTRAAPVAARRAQIDGPAQRGRLPAAARRAWPVRLQGRLRTQKPWTGCRLTPIA